MAKIVVLNDNNFTGAVTSPEVIIPIQASFAYAEVILSAPISELNIFDISLRIEVFENDNWVVRDNNFFGRDIETGPLEAINISMRVRLERLAGKRVRAVLSCGQSVLSASIILTT